MVVGRHRLGKTSSWLQRRLRVAGAVLLAVSASIHLDLYLTGYRSIPTIGWLFLLQAIAGFGLTTAALVTRSWLAAAASAVFALSTLSAYLLAVWIGLFGFKEVRTRAGIAAGLIEVAAFAVLALAAIAAGPVRQADGPVSPDARYWFAPDTPATSKCTGPCTAYWPPVTGNPSAGPGVTGQLGTIKRPGGDLQATYDGHPLYTYVGDNGPGQAQGNNLNLNGGLWYEVRVSR